MKKIKFKNEWLKYTGTAGVPIYPNEKDKEGRSVLMVAVFLYDESPDCLDYVKHLIECGAKVNNGKDKEGNTPLSWAIVYKNKNDEAMIRLLLERGANPNQKGIFKVPPIFLAYIYAPSLIPILVEFGADLNMKDISGHTLAHQIEQDFKYKEEKESILFEKKSFFDKALLIQKLKEEENPNCSTRKKIRI